MSPFNMYLNQDRILELVSVFSAAGLVKNDTLDGLLASLPRSYAASLPQDGAPLNRLMMTLEDLNRTERLIDGTVPFGVWLRHSVLYAAGKEAPLDAINRALADVSRRASGGGLPRGSGGNFPGTTERIVGTNDLLPFDFLRRGAEAGLAVARLTVSRYDAGQLVQRSGVPVRSLGTGWLLSPSLLITNHHVVNARGDDEPDVSPADLTLQAQSIEAQFDYERSHAAGVTRKVAQLLAFAPRGGPLDYAILRLAEAVDRKALSLVTTPFNVPANADSHPSVNIIQHPQGDPKMVACRNNLVTRAEGTQLWYFTDTMGGSSGSPVLDDEWRVVALHKRWDYLQGVTYQGRDTAWANQGTQMFAIVEHLRASGHSALLTEIGLG